MEKRRMNSKKRYKKSCLSARSEKMRQKHRNIDRFNKKEALENYKNHKDDKCHIKRQIYRNKDKFIDKLT